MILYFTGTGNSRYTAEMIATVIGGTTLSINEYIKTEKAGSFQSEAPYVFVCPTYAWRIPRIVEHFLETSKFRGSRKAYFVLTCGTETGNASGYAKALCKKKSMEFMGLAAVVMPENYIALYDVPDRMQAQIIVQKSVPQMFKIAEAIKNGRPLETPPVTALDKFRSAVVNPEFYRFVVSAKGFHVTDKCSSCGKCTEMCPLNNIRLEAGKPIWGEKCTHCMACICACPQEAIEYKNNSHGKPRYFNLDEPTIRL